jgi:hypothetical protein
MSESIPRAPLLEPLGRYVPPKAAHPVLIPDPGPDDEVAAPVAPARPSQSLRRVATYVAVSLGGAALAIVAVFLMGSRAESPQARHSGSGAEVAAAGNAVTLLDRRADTLALALDAFSMRAGMFDARRMACAGLARGLQQVETGWVAYNLARKDALTALDSTRGNRDRALFSNVRAVELRFERSPCVRP